MNFKLSYLNPRDKAALDYFSDSVTKILKNRVADIYLFGSKARNHDSSESDMDICLLLTGTVRKIKVIDLLSDLVLDILLKYQVLISILPVNTQEFQENQDRLLYSTIRNDGIKLC